MPAAADAGFVSHREGNVTYLRWDTPPQRPMPSAAGRRRGEDAPAGRWAPPRMTPQPFHALRRYWRRSPLRADLIRILTGRPS